MTDTTEPKKVTFMRHTLKRKEKRHNQVTRSPFKQNLVCLNPRQYPSTINDRYNDWKLFNKRERIKEVNNLQRLQIVLPDNRS